MQLLQTLHLFHCLWVMLVISVFKLCLSLPLRGLERGTQRAENKTETLQRLLIIFLFPAHSCDKGRVE